MEHDIIIYTTPTCSWCQAVKDYMNQRNLEFAEVDVAADRQQAQEMIQKSGQMGVPVVEIDGETVVGFDRSRIEALLERG